MKKYIDIPPVWALTMIVSSWALAAFVPLFSIQIPLVVSLAIAGLGIGLAGWSALWFRRKKTTIEPRHVPSSLIVEGPFKVNRNPIYTGMALVLLGFSLWLGDLMALLPVVLFPVIITKRFIVEEETQLKKLFGDNAIEYIGKSRRW